MCLACVRPSYFMYTRPLPPNSAIHYLHYTTVPVICNQQFTCTFPFLREQDVSKESSDLTLKFLIVLSASTNQAQNCFQKGGLGKPQIHGPRKKLISKSIGIIYKIKEQKKPMVVKTYAKDDKDFYQVSKQCREVL